MAKLNIDILTLFPQMFSGPFQESMIGRAQSKGVVNIRIHNIRDFTKDKHRKVDDRPFGGGAGMLIKVEPIFNALKKLSGLKKQKGKTKPYVVYLSPQGKPLKHQAAIKLSKKSHLILICGHYEGIDERAMRWIDEEISIGDYILTCGELPAMVVVDTVVRLVPGVVQKRESIKNDSFYQKNLDCSQYTRPAEFLGMKVPKVLLSGNHKEIRDWKIQDSLNNTIKKRPDLIKNQAGR